MSDVDEYELERWQQLFKILWIYIYSLSIAIPLHHKKRLRKGYKEVNPRYSIIVVAREYLLHFKREYVQKSEKNSTNRLNVYLLFNAAVVFQGIPIMRVLFRKHQQHHKMQMVDTAELYIHSSLRFTSLFENTKIMTISVRSEKAFPEPIPCRSPIFHRSPFSPQAILCGYNIVGSIGEDSVKLQPFGVCSPLREPQATLDCEGELSVFSVVFADQMGQKWTISTISRLNNSKPVSYTHLDVYKRQDHNKRMTGTSLEGINLFSAVLHLCDLLEFLEAHGQTTCSASNNYPRNHRRNQQCLVSCA